MRLVWDPWRNSALVDKLRRTQLNTLWETAASVATVAYQQQLGPLAHAALAKNWIRHLEDPCIGYWSVYSRGGARLCTAPAVVVQAPVDNFVNFRDLVSWEKVQEKVDALGGKITSDQVCAALGCLKKIHQKEHTVPEGLLMDLCAKALREDHTLNARQITDVLHACGKMKFGDMQLLEHVAGLVVGSKATGIDTFDARNLSTLIYSLGVLRGLVDKDAYSKGSTGMLVEAAIGQLPTKVLTLDVRQIVQVLYGLSMLKHNDQGLITKVLAPLANPVMLQSTTETELFSIAYSLAELRTKHPEFVKSLALEMCRPERASNVQQAGAAGFIHSLCRLKFGNYGIMGNLIDLALSSDSKKTAGPLDITQIVYGLGVVNMIGHPQIEELGKKCTNMKFLRECTDQQIANLVNGFVRLKHMPSDLEAALVKEIGKKKRLSKFTDQGLANILHGLSRRNAGDAEWKAKVAAEATKKTRLSSSTSQGLSNILYSFRQWGYCGEAVAKLLNEIVKESRLKEHDSHTLASILYSLSAMNYSNIQVLNLIIAECIKPQKLSALKAQGISNVIVAVSNLGIRDSMVWNLLAMEASKPSRLTSFTEQGLVQIVSALQHVKFQNDSLLASIGKEILVPERLGDYSPESLANVLIILTRSDFSWRWMDMTAVRHVLHEVTKPTRVHGFSERGLCSILKSIRLLNIKNPQAVRTLVAEAMSDRIFPNLHDRGLCSILVSISKLELNDRDVTTKICKRLLEDDVFKQLRPQDITVIVDCLYWMDFCPPDCAEKLVDTVADKDFVVHCTGNELSLLLRGFGGLGLGDETVGAFLVRELCSPERTGKLSGKQIATVVDACLELRVAEEDPIKAILDRHQEVLATAGHHHLIQVLIGLCKLGTAFDGYVEHYVKELASKTRVLDIVDADLTKLVQLLKAANFPVDSRLENERVRRLNEDKSEGPGDSVLPGDQTMEQLARDKSEASQGNNPQIAVSQP